MSEDRVAIWLPTVRGHVINSYGWISRRGHCMLDIDDLVQIACIELMKLDKQWEEIRHRENIAADNDAAFMGYLKPRVKMAVLKYSNSVTDDQRSYAYPSADETYADSDQSAVEVRGLLPFRPDAAGDGIALNDIVDFFSLMSPRDKALIGLRYFDELPLKQVSEVFEFASGSSMITRAVDRLRDFAKNQYLDSPIDIAPHKSKKWEPPATLLSYLHDRHRKDLSEYLGYVTICFRADVSYMVDILGKKYTFTPTSMVRSSAVRTAVFDEVDRLLADGRSQASIVRETGFSKKQVESAAHRRAA